MAKKWTHGYSISFEVESDDSDPEAVSVETIKSALMAKCNRMNAVGNSQWREECEPYDTYETDKVNLFRNLRR